MLGTMGNRQLETLSFDNSYARLPEAFYSKLNPTCFEVPPMLISFNPAAAELIDLDPGEAKRPEFAGVFGGSLLLPGMEPLAMLKAAGLSQADTDAIADANPRRLFARLK